MAGYDSNLSGDFVKNALIYANDMQGGLLLRFQQAGIEFVGLAI
jgi:hypothetical protein